MQTRLGNSSSSSNNNNNLLPVVAAARAKELGRSDRSRKAKWRRPLQGGGEAIKLAGNRLLARRRRLDDIERRGGSPQVAPRGPRNVRKLITEQIHLARARANRLPSNVIGAIWAGKGNIGIEGGADRTSGRGRNKWPPLGAGWGKVSRGRRDKSSSNRLPLGSRARQPVQTRSHLLIAGDFN